MPVRNNPPAERLHDCKHFDKAYHMGRPWASEALVRQDDLKALHGLPEWATTLTEIVEEMRTGSRILGD